MSGSTPEIGVFTPPASYLLTVRLLYNRYEVGSTKYVSAEHFFKSCCTLQADAKSWTFRPYILRNSYLVPVLI